MLQIVTKSSPNFNDRPAPWANKPDMIILHYTGMQSGHEALARLCDADAGVSAHYMIEADGQIFQMVPDEKRAWHAGLSYWQGKEGVNDCAIGIEIVNPGHEWGYSDFPTLQMSSVLSLTKQLKQKWQVADDRIIGHSDVAPLRKEDPGEKFPWGLLALNGMGLKPYPDGDIEFEDDAPIDYASAQKLLKKIGYGFESNHPAAAVLAFQRHFCPSQLGQGLNPHTKYAIDYVAAQLD